jgi:choline monooxygenase
MLTSALFKDFDATGPLAHGLPALSYTSDEFLQLEFRTLFSSYWVFVGFAHEMLMAGDVRPVEVAGLPLFLLRDADGGVSAFHNVCRHRNLKLVDNPANCGKLIRCPYHSWSYDLCGELKNAPYFGGAMREMPPDFSYDDNGLMPVHCEVWHDWIFVNLAPEPLPFEDFTAPIRAMLGDNLAEDYVPRATVEFGEVPCNWKLLMENFIEPYHVQFVHKTTTRQPLEDHYTLIEDHCLGSAVELSPEQQEQADLTALGVTSHYLTLFPSFILGTYQPDQMGVYLHQPVDAGHTRQRRVIYTHRDADYSDAQIQQLKELWHSVHLEDHEMCERMQQGRHSPLASDGGLLSPHWENSVRRFQELVADAVRPALTE